MNEDLRVLPSTTVGPDPFSGVLRVGSTISWGGIFSGAFVAVLTYLGLTALGVAIGGAGLQHVISQESGAGGLSIGAGIWLIVSGIIALFVGGYVAARASGVIPTRSGGMEGLVVAAFFFVLFITGLGAGVGALGSAAGSMVSALGSGAGSVAQSPAVQSAVSQGLGDLQLRSSPGQVAGNLGSMLLRGDTDGATSYIARQAGISRLEAKQRIDQMRSQVVGAAKDAGITAAKATQAAGWSLFIMIVLGSTAALFGGALAARRNIRRPVSEKDRRIALESRREWSPLGGPQEAPRTT